jgi:hypothetical protein
MYRFQMYCVYCAFQLHVDVCEVRIAALFFPPIGAMSMAEWEFAQTNPAQALAELQFFSIKKRQGDQTIEIPDHGARVCATQPAVDAFLR